MKFHDDDVVDDMHEQRNDRNKMALTHSRKVAGNDLYDTETANWIHREQISRSMNKSFKISKEKYRDDGPDIPRKKVGRSAKMEQHNHGGGSSSCPSRRRRGKTSSDSEPVPTLGRSPVRAKSNSAEAAAPSYGRPKFLSS